MVARVHHQVACAALVAACVAAVGVSSLLSRPAGAAPGNPGSAQELVRDGRHATIVPTRATSPLDRCLATWNRTSGMSKREWKQTCKRVVKQNPGLYGKPF